jgi:hypothetical protein
MRRITTAANAGIVWLRGNLRQNVRTNICRRDFDGLLIAAALILNQVFF